MFKAVCLGKEAGKGRRLNLWFESCRLVGCLRCFQILKFFFHLVLALQVLKFLWFHAF